MIKPTALIPTLRQQRSSPQRPRYSLNAILPLITLLSVSMVSSLASAFTQIDNDALTALQIPATPATSMMGDDPECSSYPIKAQYQVSTHAVAKQAEAIPYVEGQAETYDPKAALKKSTIDSYALTIYRNADHVIYEYPDSQLADVWQLAMNDQLELGRYFTGAKRAITYTSSDLKNVGNRNSWAKLFGIVDMRDKTPLVTQGSGCQTISDYEQQSEQIDYLDKLRLPTSMVFFNPDSQANSSYGYQLYQLTSLSYSNEIEDKLAEFQEYDETDFADIGDKEADPFISRMIHQGFIEHSAHNGADSHGVHHH